MKTKILLIAEIEHGEPLLDQSARGVAEDRLDAFREAVLPTENYGITLYQVRYPVVALCGNLSDGYKAVGPYEDFDHASDHHDGDECWLMECRMPKLREEAVS